MFSDQNNDIAIEITDLGKCYPIYNRPSDRLKQMLMRGCRQYYKEFWALSDVSFTLRKGETVGIIGRNGSGKSTLLQMICGTLNPTVGDVNVNGRVAALLELGAGFNPEFSGVENVYMAAALYGLNKQEVDKRFDAIAAFADIGEHIYQPVKHYSSGMYVRLAFAVIAHVDADILVVDEALAVGDAIFTQKCMRFIRKFRENGTLLFVSHDMGSVLNLCESVIWLDKGAVRMAGEAKPVSEAYLQYTLQDVYGEKTPLQTIENLVPERLDEATGLAEHTPEDENANGTQSESALQESGGWKTGGAEIVYARFEDASGQTINGFKGGESATLVIKVKTYQDVPSPIIGFFVKDRLGQSLFGEHTFTYQPTYFLSAGAQCEARFKFVMPMLPNGDYAVTVSIAEGTPADHIQHHWLHDALIFRVLSEKLRYGLVGIPMQEVTMETLK